MKMKLTAFIILVLIFPRDHSRCQWRVPVGDTTWIGYIATPDLNGCDASCYDFSWGFYHVENSDFYFDSIKPSGPPQKKIMFAPKKVGLQTDTCKSYVYCYNPKYGGRCAQNEWSYPESAIGISDSASLFFFLTSVPDSNAIVYYFWKWRDSLNSYSDTLVQPIEIINNVKDSVPFSYFLNIDTSPDIHAKVILDDGRSFELPGTIFIASWTRRLYGKAIFISDSKGFSKDTTFKASLSVVVKKTMSIDTIKKEYHFIFAKKPEKSSPIISNNDEMVIFVSLTFSGITIKSNFFPATICIPKTLRCSRPSAAIAHFRIANSGRGELAENRCREYSFRMVYAADEDEGSGN
jgi:hypothetical protein